MNEVQVQGEQVQEVNGGGPSEQDKKAEVQATITKEFELLISDLKLNQYGAVAIEVFVNKVLQLMQ